MWFRKSVRWGGALVLVAAATYLIFVSGLFIGLQPFGQGVLDEIAWPLREVKRGVIGRDPLLPTRQYKVATRDELLFDEAVGPLFEGPQLARPNLLSVLPRDVSPKNSAAPLDEVFLESNRGRLGGSLQSYTVRRLDNAYLHIFDFGWTRVHFLAKRAEIRNCASLIVPGSGTDLASQILLGEGYHGDLFAQVPCTTLVYVKPNHDTRQIVYKDHRVNFDYLYTSLIGINSIYSYWYIEELIETALYLKTVSDAVLVVGLSQGGGAAMIVGAVANLAVTAVLSGYYVPDGGQFGNFHQILIPSMTSFLQPEEIGKYFRQGQLILTYGKQDLPVYRLAETQDEACSRLIASEARVTCVFHDSGHTYPNNLRPLLQRALDQYRAEKR